LKILVDLSHDLTEGMPVYPGIEMPVFRKAYTIEENGFAEMKVDFYTHTGTHIDSPAHILKNSKSISNLDVGHFVGKAFVARYTASNPIKIQWIKKEIDRVGKPDFILLSCGWDQYWSSDDYFSDFPLPGSEVFHYLSQLGLKGVGIDAISIDSTHSSTLINHRLLLASNTIIIENLKDLHKIPDGIFEFFCFPLKIYGGDGSPVRAVARYSTNGYGSETN
jgi:arylformamidase